MAEYIATTAGLFPLPDWTKDRLSSLKGHQRDDLVTGDEPEAVVAAYDEARAEVVELQRDAGLDRVVEGQLRWDDMLAHPLAVSDAVETRGLVRYYDNNNFYRDPVVVDALAPTGDVAAELAAAAELTDAPRQAVLPGPYSLAALATDEYYGDEQTFLAAVGEFLAGEVADFPPVETLFLLEPSLVNDPPNPSERAAVAEAIDSIAQAGSGAVVVYPYWGALDPQTHATLLETAIDAVGYDLVTAPEACAGIVEDAGTLDAVALGVVDGQNTLVETTGTVRERVARFEAALSGPVETVYLAPNTELFHLPFPTFAAKLEALAAAGAPEVRA